MLYWIHSANRQSDHPMADFRENTNADSDGELIVAVDEGRFHNLAHDDVILDWLMNLEAEDSAADLDESRRERQTQYAHC